MSEGPSVTFDLTDEDRKMASDASKLYDAATEAENTNADTEKSEDQVLTSASPIHP